MQSDRSSLSVAAVWVLWSLCGISMMASSARGILPPETVWAPAAPDTLSPPGYLESVYDSTCGIRTTRISDPDAFHVPEAAGALQHQYSKIQAWNADMSKILIGFTHVLNAHDYSIWKDIAPIYTDGYFNDGRWSNVDPNIRYFCWEDHLLKIDIAAEKVDTLHTFPGYYATIGPWEGNLSADDRYVVVTDNNGPKRASLYDLAHERVVSTRSFGGDTTFDWATITPWGDYIVVSNNTSGHTELYDLDFHYLRDLTVDQEHGDFAVDTEGNEVFVEVIPLTMTRLSDGQRTDLLPDARVCGWAHENPNIPGHVSGRNFLLPGWALVSTPIKICSNGRGYFYATDIFEVKLDGSGIIRHFGYSRSSWDSYDSSTRATVSPDGRKVIFSSDWNMYGNGGPVRAYVSEYGDVPTVVEDSAAEPAGGQSAEREAAITVQVDYARGTVRVDAAAADKYVIYNVLGQAVLRGTLRPGSNGIDISGLDRGLYFLRAGHLGTRGHAIRITVH